MWISYASHTPHGPHALYMRSQKNLATISLDRIKMKLLFVQCLLLAATVTSLEAAPAPSKPILLYKVLTKADAVGTVENLKDIWSDCSKYSID